MIFPDKNIILRISDLSIQTTGNFPVTIIDNLSIDIEKSKITAMIGESGSGKTLTALSIPGLTKYIENTKITGKILFKEETKWIDILSLSEKKLTEYRGKKISLIMQDPLSSFDPNKKCGKQLIEVIRIHRKINSKQARAYAGLLIKKMKLEPRVLDVYPHQLSGGELQRFAIANAVSSDPELIIADEPTTNLDANLTAGILDIIRDINREKAISFLFISHDLKVVKAIADNVCMIKSGRLLEYRPSHEFFVNPESIFSLTLIDAYFNFSLQETKKTKNNNSIELLKVSNLYKTFTTSIGFPFFNPSAKINALQNISFSIFEGETIGIIGESGCGKSTLARILVKLDQADSGEIFLLGKKISNPKSSDHDFVRKNIQMVFQNPITSLNKIIKVKKLLKEPFETGNTADKKDFSNKLNILAGQLGINDSLRDRYSDQISGGEAQRIALARAMAYDPKIIVMDESLSALDKISQNEILILLNELKQKNCTSFIFITHDLSLARYFCDRLLIMKNGTIVEHGPASNIFSSPENQYTKSLLNAIF